MRTQSISRFDFRVRVAEAYTPLAQLSAEQLVQAWVADPKLRCCSFIAGPFIDIDGVPWSDEGTIDELWMTMFWFQGILALHEGATVFGAWRDGVRETVGPWEESRLVLTRDAENLEMADIHLSGAITMRPVVVDFRELARHFGAVAAPFAALMRSCRTVVEELKEPRLARTTILENLLEEKSLSVLDRVTALARC